MHDLYMYLVGQVFVAMKWPINLKVMMHMVHLAHGKLAGVPDSLLMRANKLKTVLSR